MICADSQAAEAAKALRAAGLVPQLLGAVMPAPGEGAPGGGDEASADRAGMAGRLTIVPVTLAKGLEFDHVVLVEPGRIASGEAFGLRRLYVALTRAVSRLTVLYAEPIPGELRYVT